MQTAVHDSLVAFIHAPFVAANPGVAIVFGNNPFDWNDPPASFVEVEIEFYAGSQVGVALTPKTRLRGCVYVCAYARTGTGNRAALGLLDWFSARLRYARVGTANLQAPEPDGNPTRKGWHIAQLKIEFHTDPS